MMSRASDAGLRLLRRFLDAEQNTLRNLCGRRLSTFRNSASGKTFLALRLNSGDGGEKAAAMKLVRDGMAMAGWHRGARWMIPTEAGRRAAA